MKKQKLVIVGDTEFAEIACDYFTMDADYDVVAFAVEKPFYRQKTLKGRPVVLVEEVDKLYPPDEYMAFTAIVFTQLNRVRTRLYNLMKQKGYRMASYVSSHAFVWENAQIGENTFIFEDNTIQYNVKIGNNVVLWSGNHIGHSAHIGDNTFIASHAVVSGYVQIGESCFVGVNVTIGDNISIAADTLLGAGAVVVKDITETGHVLVGNPAKALEKTSYVSMKVQQQQACESTTKKTK